MACPRVQGSGGAPLVVAADQERVLHHVAGFKALRASVQVPPLAGAASHAPHACPVLRPRLNLALVHARPGPAPSYPAKLSIHQGDGEAVR